MFGTGAGFYWLLSVVPLYAASVGAGAIGAGEVTGVLMFSTVATELATPWLLARFGYRLVFGVALLAQDENETTGRASSRSVDVAVLHSRHGPGPGSKRAPCRTG